MKKYITPAIEIENTEVFEMIALSMKNEPANGSEVLSRDNVEWDMWNDEVE